MDENNIQILGEDLTEEYHNLAKSHTAAIEQLLEDFNDDQMIFRLEAEPYEEERLAAINNNAPTTDNHEPEPTTTNTTEARQEGPALADTHTTLAQQPATTTLPESVLADDTQRETAATQDSIEKPSDLPNSLTNHTPPRISSAY